MPKDVMQGSRSNGVGEEREEVSDVRSSPAGESETRFTHLTACKETNAGLMDATESVCLWLINNKFWKIPNKHDEIKCTATARSKRQIYP